MDSKTGGVNPPVDGPRKAVVGLLAGGPAEVAERDLATAATPHSVEDR